MEWLSTVYIVDNSGENLSALLQDSPGRATETYMSGGDFMENANLVRPACVIIAFEQPDMPADALLQRLRDKSDVPVIMTGKRWELKTVLRCLRLGVLDCFTTPVEPRAFRELLDQALQQDRELTEVRRRVAEARNKLAVLSNRQRELFSMFANGLSRKEIASTLHISPRTVENHRANLNRLLRTNRLADLVQLHLLTSAASCRTCPRMGGTVPTGWTGACNADRPQYAARN